MARLVLELREPPQRNDRDPARGRRANTKPGVIIVPPAPRQPPAAGIPIPVGPQAGQAGGHDAGRTLGPPDGPMRTARPGPPRFTPTGPPILTPGPGFSTIVPPGPCTTTSCRPNGNWYMSWKAQA